MIDNVQAKLLMRERLILSRRAFVEKQIQTGLCRESALCDPLG